MIKINNIEYDIENIEIDWSNYTNQDDIQKLALSLTFNIKNNEIKKSIFLETLFSRENFENLPINSLLDFKKYISDIQFEEDNLLTKIFDIKSCNLIKKDYKIYNLKLECNDILIDELLSF